MKYFNGKVSQRQFFVRKIQVEIDGWCNQLGGQTQPTIKTFEIGRSFSWEMYAGIELVQRL